MLAGPEPEPMPPDLARALAADPTLGGKLHDVHGGPGEDCWCGYVGHDPPPIVSDIREAQRRIEDGDPAIFSYPDGE